MANTHKIYVYGTLIPRGAKDEDAVFVLGYLYDLGWYPGIKLASETETDSRVKCHIIEVDDDRLIELDRYEGYRESDSEGSLYIRKMYEDGWIYVYNQSLRNAPLIEGGDWRAYEKAELVGG